MSLSKHKSFKDSVSRIGSLFGVILLLSMLVVTAMPPEHSDAFEKNGAPGKVEGSYENDRIINMTTVQFGFNIGDTPFRFEGAAGKYTYAGDGSGSESYIAISEDPNTGRDNYWQRDLYKKFVEDRFGIGLGGMKRFESGSQGKGVCRSLIFVDSAHPERAFGVFNPSNQGKTGSCFMAAVAENLYGVAVGEFTLTGTDKIVTVPDSGEWRDATTIKFNNSYYRDSDVFDGNHSYEGEYSGECGSTIKASSYGSDGNGKTGDITYRRKTGTSCEVVASKRINLSNDSMHAINGFLLKSSDGDDVIFMPQYDDCSPEGESSNCPNKTMGFFKRLPTSDSKRKDTVYWQWAGGTRFIDACGDVGHIWIDRTELKQKSQNKACRGIAEFNIYIANGATNPPPADVYGAIDVDKATVAGANGNPGGSSDGSIQDKEAVTENCESKSGLDLGWILCPVLDFMDNIIGGDGADGVGLLGMVDDLLRVESAIYDNDQMKQTWSYFKDLASFMIILVGLVMVVGQAVSKE